MKVKKPNYCRLGLILSVAAGVANVNCFGDKVKSAKRERNFEVHIVFVLGRRRQSGIKDRLKKERKRERERMEQAGRQAVEGKGERVSKV